MTPGPDLILEGDGDVWHFVDTPKRGKRSFTYDAATDLFTDENYDAYPLSYDIDQIGAAKKNIAITFDDGPDPRWTPQILEHPQREERPGRFFCNWLAQASEFPEILKREYAEGHEIGNHTYTHPNFETRNHQDANPLGIEFDRESDREHYRSEVHPLSSSFGIDHQPEYAEEVAQLPIAQDMGYLIVGQKIDSMTGSRPPGARFPDKDHQQCAAEAEDGNIVLFHDGGGDRPHTVLALPRVIDALRD